MDLAFLRQKPFWIYQVPNIIQSLAGYLPQLWIPSFARAMGLPSFCGPIAVCLLNLAMCGGLLLHGRLVDRFHSTTVILISTICAIISVFLFWGFATNQAMLYAFSILWGLTGAGFPGTWAGYTKDLRRYGRSLDTGLVISLMCAGRGIGSVVSGPLSARLLRVTPWGGAGFAYGSQYGPMIVFTGVCAMVGGSSFVARLLRLL